MQDLLKMMGINPESRKKLEVKSPYYVNASDINIRIKNPSEDDYIGGKKSDRPLHKGEILRLIRSEALMVQEITSASGDKIEEEVAAEVSTPDVSRVLKQQNYFISKSDKQVESVISGAEIGAETFPKTPRGELPYAEHLIRKVFNVDTNSVGGKKLLATFEKAKMPPKRTGNKKEVLYKIDAEKITKKLGLIKNPDFRIVYKTVFENTSSIVKAGKIVPEGFGKLLNTTVVIHKKLITGVDGKKPINKATVKVVAQSLKEIIEANKALNEVDKKNLIDVIDTSVSKYEIANAPVNIAEVISEQKEAIGKNTTTIVSELKEVGINVEVWDIKQEEISPRLHNEKSFLAFADILKIGDSKEKDYVPAKGEFMSRRQQFAYYAANKLPNNDPKSREKLFEKLVEKGHLKKNEVEAIQKVEKRAMNAMGR